LHRSIQTDEHKEKGDPVEGIALESTGVVLGGDKQEKQ
jgi:hypothetical protein